MEEQLIQIEDSEVEAIDDSSTDNTKLKRVILIASIVILIVSVLISWWLFAFMIFFLILILTIISDYIGEGSTYVPNKYSGMGKR